MRHDPDVVLVGEIRDLETAENAIQASLTGHLVFSTLHTNDAAGAFMRLVDMGVEPFLVSSTVEGIMAQRLVRTLCDECREPMTPKPKTCRTIFPWDAWKRNRSLSPVGCRTCRNAGYSGRMGVYELLETNDEIRQLATERSASTIIKKAAMKRGCTRCVRTDGTKCWKAVPIDEVLRVSKED